MLRLLRPLRALAPAALLAASMACAPAAFALEHITLVNGFEIDCVRRELVHAAPQADKLRLYMAASGAGEENYIDVSPSSILRVEVLPDPPASFAARPAAALNTATLPQLLAHAGSLHRIDAELLAAVVHAESDGRADAVSRTGARGLMQLMPSTASLLGVADAFVPAQNVEGGTAYLDQLLVRYHDNVALALAAYNAGPGAVDRYHGIPPFRETRAYVSRVIREFNRRKTALLAQNKEQMQTPAGAAHSLASALPLAKVQ